MLLFLAVLVSFPVRIAVLGDRTGRPDDNEFGIAISAIEEMSPDIVLSVGDFVEGDGDVETAVEDWENILPTLERLTSRFPFVYTPGNNDIWNDETEAIWLEYTGRDPSRVEEHLGINFVVWDTSRDDDLSLDDLDTIDELLSTIDTDDPWILVTHKPFWFMAHQDQATVDEFKRRMESSGPLAVVGGHIHLFAASRENGILYVSAGPSGSSVPDPDPDRGDFTQLGWMTVWPDSVAYSEIDARGVYPENINTGEEMNYAYLYRTELLRLRPLDMGQKSTLLTLVPVEDIPRVIALNIDPGCWSLNPDSLQVDLSDEPVEVHLEQSDQDTPYPSPVIQVSLVYGSRDKELLFEQAWPVLRTMDAFRREQPVVDGQLSPGEYPGEPQTAFADDQGQPSVLPATGFRAATDGNRLFLNMEMANSSSLSDDYAGFIFTSEDTFYWLRVWRDGSAEAMVIPPSWDMTEWESGFQFAVTAGDSEWCAEVAVDISMLDIESDAVGVHVYRSAEEGFGTWAYPIEFDIFSMGRIWLQPQLRQRDY